MELQGHWNPGVMQPLTPDNKIPSFLGWFPFPNVPGSKALPGSLLGGGDGFACSVKAPQPQCAQFLAYIDSMSVQRRIGSTSFGLPVREGLGELGQGPEPQGGAQVPLELAVRPALPRHRILGGDRTGARRRGREPVRGQGDATAGHRTDRGRGKAEVGVEHPRRTTPAAHCAAGRRTLPPKWVEIALFVGPAIALYVLFLLVPVVQAVHYSFYSWTGLGDLTDFVGLHNYREAFGDPFFRQAMEHNGILVGALDRPPAPTRTRRRAAAQPAASRPRVSFG